MNISRIDEAILSAAGERWTKVAMVIARVAGAMGSDLPPGDEGLQIISNRIENLVRGGSVASQGNVQNWRFSELRRAGDNLQPNSPETLPKHGNMK